MTRRGGLSRRAAVVAAAVAVLAVGCASSEAGSSSRASGIQMSGRMSSVASVAVSDGRPELLDGDCHETTDVPAQVCFATRGISGTTYVIGLANLAGLPRGEPVEVAADPCATAQACAEVQGRAVVFLSVDGRVLRPESGTAVIRRAERGERYRGRLRLEIDGGSVSIDFDVVPAPPEPGGAPPQPRGAPPQPGGAPSPGESNRPRPGEAFTPGEVEAFGPGQGGS